MIRDPRAAAVLKMEIANKYKYQNDIEHVLANAGMYIGSLEPVRQTLWLYEDAMATREIEFHPALYKIVDEPLTNCYDHYVRSRVSADPVKTIRVVVEDARVSIFNDGESIDVVKHPDLDIYIPEMVFGTLRTSANYGPEDKIVGGKHGLGVKLTAVWSSLFQVDVVDAGRGLAYSQTFRDNLQIAPPTIRKTRASGGSVQISFSPDFARFGVARFPDYFPSLVKKRLYDLALLAPEVRFYFNGKPLTRRAFKHYIESCIHTTKYAAHETRHWKVAAAASDAGFVQVSFVNGIHTLHGGRHVDAVVDSLLAALRDLIKKRKQVSVPLKVLKDQLFVFVACDVVNPSFSGQIKESLISRQFAEPVELPAEFVEKMYKYVAAASCSLWTAREKLKKEKQDTKLLHAGNGSKVESVRGIPELTDANWAGTSRSQRCTLIVCEGLSAATGILSGMASQDRDRLGVYPLRGKLFNPQDKGADKIAANKIISDLKKVLGLESGKTYTSTARLRYGQVVLMTDQDLDGAHIKGLALNVFFSLWPSLLSLRDFIGFAPTPIVKAARGARREVFYYAHELDAWRARTPDAAAWTLKYYKGLGTSTAAEFKEYFKDLRVIFFEAAGDTEAAFKMAFSRAAADQRKSWLMRYDRGAAMRVSPENRVSYSSFVNDELIHFSKYDCDRSIPSVDGLKISQRKILFTAFKDARAEIKVAQFCGRVAQLTHYHHGEVNLEGAIVGMAQRFVGSNNVHLLEPLGQFGSRIAGGDDAASARYIFTRVAPLARYIFRPEDDPILEYNEEEGQRVEPRFYVPVVPMVLVNGASGIGTGFSSQILPHDLADLARRIKDRLEGRAPAGDLRPFFRGFRGRVEGAAGKYTTTGVWRREGMMLEVSELPVGMWNLAFREHLESLVEAGVVRRFTDASTDERVLFSVELAREVDDVVKTFKLHKTHSETNMYLFDADDRLRKFDSCEQIVEYYMDVRARFYQRRKEYTLEQLAREVAAARDKARFVRAAARREIDVFGPRRDLERALKERGFERAGELMDLPVSALQEENAARLERKHGELEERARRVAATSVRDMWLEDLEELLKILGQIESSS